jgi:hypothetical protein
MSHLVSFKLAFLRNNRSCQSHIVLGGVRTRLEQKSSTVIGKPKYFAQTLGIFY